MKAIVSPVIGRLAYWGCVALCALGAAVLYAQSEGLIRLPAVKIARPAFLVSSEPE